VLFRAPTPQTTASPMGTSPVGWQLAATPGPLLNCAGSSRHDVFVARVACRISQCQFALFENGKKWQE
jgi:hypothetical protein